jgi:hypothetical protein
MGLIARTFIAGLVALLLAAPLQISAGELPRPLERWRLLEQKALSRQVDTTRLLALDNHQEKAYAPESGQTFEVKSYWIDAKRLHAFTGEGLPAELRGQFFRKDRGRDQVRLLVHPESEGFYREFLVGATPAPSFRATATASSRTLLAWPPGDGDHAFFAKLSLDKEIGGVVRTIPMGEVARSIGLNNVLHQGGASLPASFRFLPEVIGVIPKGMERGGMIIRAIPEDVRSGDMRYMPLFSLYAPRSGGRPPLIARMIETSGLSAPEFVRQKLIRPFVRQWLDLTVKQGIAMEPHAQNVLVEIGRDGLPTGSFLHRDLGGFNIDFKFRKSLSIRTPRRLPVLQSMKKDYFTDKSEKVLRNLETYFQGGFVYNLDQELPKLARRWPAGPKVDKVERGTFSRMLLDEVEQQTGKLLGREVTLGNDPSRIPALILESRERYRLSQPGLHGTLRRASARLLGLFKRSAPVR